MYEDFHELETLGSRITLLNSNFNSNPNLSPNPKPNPHYCPLLRTPWQRILSGYIRGDFVSMRRR